MKKKFLAILIAVISAIVCAFGFAACGGEVDGSDGLQFTLNSKENTYSVSGIENNKSTKVVIPATYENLPVTSIDSDAFTNCTKLKSITIPDSIITVDAGAFTFCKSLKAVYITDLAAWCQISFTYGVDGYSDANPLIYAHKLYVNGELVTDIVIPDSVTSIGDYAFDGCNVLTSITIPDSVTRIGRSAFRGCEKIIQTENGVQYVDNWAIGCDTSATQANLKVGTRGILDNAFVNCEKLTSASIPDSVTKISDYAFENCSGLTSINIPNSVKNIGREAFMNCRGLKSITIPNSVTSIGERAFERCGLTSVIIPDSVKIIDFWTFYECGGLTSVTISNGVTNIVEGAFEDCSKLESIIIPNSVTSIGEEAFYSCRKLTSITFGGTMSQWKAIEKAWRWNEAAGMYTIVCTDGKLDRKENEIKG